jgi:hypothetical protein
MIIYLNLNVHHICHKALFPLKCPINKKPPAYCFITSLADDFINNYKLNNAIIELLAVYSTSIPVKITIGYRTILF